MPIKRRIVIIYSFLQNILRTILKGINIRINIDEKTKEEQDKKTKQNKKGIESLRNECTEVNLFNIFFN